MLKLRNCLNLQGRCLSVCSFQSLSFHVLLSLYHELTPQSYADVWVTYHRPLCCQAFDKSEGISRALNSKICKILRHSIFGRNSNFCKGYMTYHRPLCCQAFDKSEGISRALNSKICKILRHSIFGRNSNFCKG